MRDIYVRHYDEDQTAYAWHECMLGNDPLPEPGERVRAIANDGGQMLTCEAVATTDGIELDVIEDEAEELERI